MSTVKNNIEFNYTANGTKKTVSSTASVEMPYIEPGVTQTKSGWQVGEQIQYRVDLVVGDGDAFDDVQSFVDTLQEGWSLVEGSLKLDGELLASQDLSCITVDFAPNSVHYLEHLCQRL